MPSQVFTTAPHWEWWIVLYFFVGGIAGGSFFISALIDLIRGEADRPISRIGYLIAFPAIIIGTILLIIDLGRPERFWHMVVQSKTWLPAFKWWSPISFGTWIVTVFSMFAFLAFVAVVVQGRGVTRPFYGLFYQLGIVSKAIQMLGAIAGLAVAGYTGILLTVTNRPVWANNNLLGFLFMVSGVSTGAAMISLLAASKRRQHEGALYSVHRMDTWLLVLELILVVALVIWLSPIISWASAAAPGWLLSWGIILLLGVIVIGLLIPLALQWNPRIMPGSALLAAVLVLIGGFVLRLVVVISSEFLDKVRV